MRRIMHEPIPAGVEEIARQVVDAPFNVHKILGPGLLESVYETCLDYELTKRRIPFRRQVVVPILYDGVTLDADLRIDLLVADCLIVEIKAVEREHPVHVAQLLTYLKLTGHRLGLLLNFNVPLIKNGIKRVVL